MKKGYIQVYTGNGKGKTTAALGLAIRSLCAGNKVFFGQFMKGQYYSELLAPNYFDQLTIEQFGDVRLICQGKTTEEDQQNAIRGLNRMKEILLSGQYDLVVFDEINTCLFFGLLTLEDVLSVLYLKPEKVEIVLTGRYAPEEIIERADLVTEMREVKHYYNAGVPARVGIEN